MSTIIQIPSVLERVQTLVFDLLVMGALMFVAFNIRVNRKSNPEKNILLPFAILRFIFKSFFGIFSLLFASTDSESRAIHDHLSGSVVVYHKKLNN